MGNTNSNLTSAAKPGASGAIFRAPKGTSLPTNAIDALDSAFVCLGYIGEEGVTNSNTRTSDTFKAWGGDTILTNQTEYTDTYKFKLLEVLNKSVLETVHGAANVSGSLATGLAVKANSKELDEYSWVIETIMRDGVLDRMVLPAGKISEVGDKVYADSDISAYDVTVTAFPDEDGNTHYEYMQSATSSV